MRPSRRRGRANPVPVLPLWPAKCGPWPSVPRPRLKETAAKIEESVSRSQRGVEISSNVGQSFTEIRDQIRTLDTLVGEIATASTEQSQGIGQLNVTVTDLDRITQENAARAEESASMAAELKVQASELSVTVGILLTLLGGRRRNDARGLPGEARPGGRRRSDRNAGAASPSSAPAISRRAPELTRRELVGGGRGPQTSFRAFA
jgi:methyl-accepting chemotaxis protein